MAATTLSGGIQFQFFNVEDGKLLVSVTRFYLSPQRMNMMFKFTLAHVQILIGLVKKSMD